MDMHTLPVAGHIAAVLAALVTWAILRWRRHAIGSNAPTPGMAVLPGSVPVLGNLLTLKEHEERVNDLYWETTLAFNGKPWMWSMPFAPSTIVLTSPAAVEHVLKTHFDYYEKGRTFKERLRPVFGDGIFTSDGDDWYWQRKLVLSTFHTASFKASVEGVFVRKLQALLQLLDRAAASGNTIDMQDVMLRLTLDIFSHVAFGVELNVLDPDSSVAPLAAALDELNMVCQQRFVNPAWRITEFVTGQHKHIEQLRASLRSFVADIITQRRQQQHHQQQQQQSQASKELGEFGHKDLITLFMESCGPNGEPVSDDFVIDAVINFIVAGRDTTAQALTWAFNAMIEHPEAEAQLLQELQQQQLPPQPSYSELKALRLAHATFLEVLRLWPSVPADMKFCARDDVLPDGTKVPAGAGVVWAPYVMGRLESIWGPDALEFRPQRFLEMPTLPSPYMCPAFNAGPRICLGKALAELEGVYVMVGVLRRYKLSHAPEQQLPVTYVMSTTLPMKGGLQVKVQRR